MSEWTRVKWSEAAQVIDLLDWAPPSDDAGRQPPEDYFRGLRDASRLEDAVFFLGMALPRHETVAWAARAVRDISEGRERPRADSDALKAALLWVQDPSDPRRRAAFEAAQLANITCAERLAAMAVFLSGGSLAPENVQPVPAPNDIAGRLGAGAILVAAAKSTDRVAAINSALDEGEAIARWGLNGPPQMTLVLTITNVDRLENGLPTRLRLDRHGAVIGRSPTADWSLPDPQHYISSVHCEIDYRDGGYVLVDKSTNGTFVNGEQQRLAGPHAICGGDVIIIGHYSIKADMGNGAGAAAAEPAAQQTPAWGGWQPQQAAPSVDEASWDRKPAAPAISGQGAMSQNWAAPAVEATPVASAWATPAPAATPASGWSSPVNNAPSAPSATDVWGQLAASNVVDWARGGFGEAQHGAPDPLGLGSGGARLRPDPLGLGAPAPAQPPPQMAQQVAAQPAAPAWGSPTVTTAPTSTPSWGPPPGAAQAPVQPPQATPTPAPTPAPAWGAPQAAPAAQPIVHPNVQAVEAELAAFLIGAGLQPSDLKVSGAQAMTAAGSALRRIISGLVVMMEARARAKAQLGAQGTSLEFDGNNPLKFARAPEKAVAQLLNPPERGFMSADRAIDDAFRDLQAHQMATLTAMQGALAATLARFSPQAIRERAETQGFLAKLLPGGREATLWHAYEREFEGVARGSDEAFMDVFAKEFRQAYERVSAEMKRKT